MLRAGFAKSDITPSTEVSLIGYDFRQRRLEPGNAGVLDPLFARVVVLENEELRGVLVSLDLAVISRELACELRQQITEKLDTSPDHVIISCTHTHSGPYPLSLSETASTDKDISAWLIRLTDAERAYPQLLTEAVLDAATRAAGKMYTVEATAQEAPLGLGYTRRVPNETGKIELCWSPTEQDHLDPAPATDPTCTVLQLSQTAGHRRLILFSHGAHGTVLGKTSRHVSADWPGAACDFIEQYETNASAVYLFGACGDVHPWIATQEDPEGVKVVGRAAAAQVSLMTHALRPNRTDPDAFKILGKTIEIAGIEMDVAVWQIGPVKLVAAPVELFGELAMDLRKAVSGPVMLATCANGFEGYWPTRAAYQEGAYEVNAARAHGRKPGDSEALVEKLIELCEAC